MAVRANSPVPLIYKILPRAEWEAALSKGAFAGSAIDLADGFIHFSAADQAVETARRYFAGQAGLMVLVIDSGVLGEGLKWEPSRGGALFPHLFRPLSCAEVIEARAAPLGEDGLPDLGELT